MAPPSRQCGTVATARPRSSSSSNSCRLLLEPTPIAPQGVLTVVQQVSLQDTKELLSMDCAFGLANYLRTPTDATFAVAAAAPAVTSSSSSSAALELHWNSRNCCSSKQEPYRPPLLSPFAPFNMPRALAGDPPEFITDASKVSLRDTALKPVSMSVWNQVEENLDQEVENEEEDADEGEGDDGASYKKVCRFRSYQSKLWQTKFKELCSHRRKYGSCVIPHQHMGAIAGLSKWIRRQRYQYKLLQQGKHSTLTQERVAALQEIGFVWHSHESAWDEKYQELVEFYHCHGHVRVPCVYRENPPLSVWVQSQRRQYRHFLRGQRSFLTQERRNKLLQLGFVFDRRTKDTLNTTLTTSSDDA
jgi:Helicase associated domain